MSVHTHLQVTVGAPSSVRRCREAALLGATDLAEAWLIVWPSEGAKDTDFVLKAHPSKARFAEVTLFIQDLEVLLRLHNLCLLCFDVVRKVAVPCDFCNDCPIPNFLNFLTNDLIISGGTSEELEEPTGEREDRVRGVVVCLCKQVSNVGDCLRSVVFKEPGATPIWEKLDLVGWLP